MRGGGGSCGRPSCWASVKEQYTKAWQASAMSYRGPLQYKLQMAHGLRVDEC